MNKNEVQLFIGKGLSGLQDRVYLNFLWYQNIINVSLRKWSYTVLS